MVAVGVESCIPSTEKGVLMVLRIVPYADVGGAWTFTDAQLEKLYLQAVADRSLARVFIAGDITTLTAWIKFFKRSDSIVHFVLDDHGKVVLMAWLNQFGPKHAQAHFCGFRGSWGKHGVIKPACQISFDYWFGLRNGHETVIDTIIGQTPANNRLAIRLMKNFCIELGTIPGLIWDASEKEFVGATIFYKRRPEHG